MKTKIRNFRITKELDAKLVESARRMGEDPSSYMRTLVEFGCTLVLNGKECERAEKQTWLIK